MISVPNLVWKWFKCTACSLLTYQQFDTHTSWLFVGSRWRCSGVAKCPQWWHGCSSQYFEIPLLLIQQRAGSALVSWLDVYFMLSWCLLRKNFAAATLMGWNDIQPCGSLARAGRSKWVCRGRDWGIYSNWRLTDLERGCFSYDYFGNDGDHLDARRPIGKRTLVSPPELFRNCWIWLTFLQMSLATPKDHFLIARMDSGKFLAPANSERLKPAFKQSITNFGKKKKKKF